MSEIWKDINGFEGYYQVSNLGRVKSIERVIEYLSYGKKKTKKICEKIFKPQFNKSGYYMVNLSVNNMHYPKQIHRLVAEAFIPNPDNKPQVDHINTIRTDNRVENLRWCTQQENTDNPLSKAKHKEYYSEHIGSNHHCARKIIQFTADNELLDVYDCIKDASEKLNVDRAHISSCCSGKRKTAGGSRWKYYDTDTYLIALMVKNLKAKGITLRNAS